MAGFDETVLELSELLNSPAGVCRQALERAGGDRHKAIQILKQEKIGRVMRETDGEAAQCEYSLNLTGYDETAAILLLGTPHDSRPFYQRLFAMTSDPYEMANLATRYAWLCPAERRSDGMEAFIRIDQFSGEVGDRGLEAYLREQGLEAALVVKALERIGAGNLARVVRKAMAACGIGGPDSEVLPIDRSSRLSAVLSELEDAFFEDGVGERLDFLFAEYLRTHPREFT